LGDVLVVLSPSAKSSKTPPKVLENIFGGREKLVEHMAKHFGVQHPVPEIQGLAERLGLVNLPAAPSS